MSSRRASKRRRRRRRHVQQLAGARPRGGGGGGMSSRRASKKAIFGGGVCGVGVFWGGRAFWLVVCVVFHCHVGVGKTKAPKKAQKNTTKPDDKLSGNLQLGYLEYAHTKIRQMTRLKLC